MAKSFRNLRKTVGFSTGTDIFSPAELLVARPIGELALLGTVTNPLASNAVLELGFRQQCIVGSRPRKLGRVAIDANVPLVRTFQPMILFPEKRSNVFPSRQFCARSHDGT